MSSLSMQAGGQEVVTVMIVDMVTEQERGAVHGVTTIVVSGW